MDVDFDLEAIYGRSISSKELAKFLGLDRRTIVKYAARWGGVEVAPGIWRFFEKRIEEVLNAEQGFETRNIAIPGKCKCAGSDETKVVSGRQQEVLSGSPLMGKRNKNRIGEEIIPDKFSVFSDRTMVE